MGTSVMNRLHIGILCRLFQNKLFFVLLGLGLLLSCEQRRALPDNTSEIIDRQMVEWSEYKLKELTLEHNTISNIQIQDLDRGAKGEWFNILYPNYEATIYCSYLPISAASLDAAITDSYALAYSHAVRADGIDQVAFDNNTRHIYGIMYAIDGKVATPIQFYVTDKKKHFLRGSLYYNQIVNPDSVMNITQYIKEDIMHLMETITWE